MENNIWTKKFTYLYIDNRDIPTEELLDLKNKIYSFWKKSWDEVFSQVGLTGAVDPDQFFRQDAIHVVLNEGHPVAMMFNTVFDSRQKCHNEFSYIQSAITALEQHKLISQPTIVQSMEYMTVDPQYRKSRLGFSLGEVLVYLSLFRMLSENIHLTVGTPRKDIKVDKTCTNCGCWSSGQSFMKYDYECDIVFCRPEEVNKETAVYEISKNLWMQYFGAAPGQQKRFKAA